MYSRIKIINRFKKCKNTEERNTLYNYINDLLINGYKMAMFSNTITHLNDIKLLIDDLNTGD